MLATVVDTSALWQTVAAALVSGVGTTLVFSLAILGAARFADANRDGRPLAAAAYATMALVAVAATLGGVAIGVVVMTTK